MSREGGSDCVMISRAAALLRLHRISLPSVFLLGTQTWMLVDMELVPGMWS